MVRVLVRINDLTLHFVRRIAFYFFHAFLVKKGEVLGTRLGVLWLFLEPLLQAAFFGAFFLILLPSQARPANYWIVVVVGILAVFPLTSSVSKASQGAYRLPKSPPPFGPNSKSGVINLVTADGIMSSAFNVVLLAVLAIPLGLAPAGVTHLVMIGLPLSALTIFAVSSLVVEAVFILRDVSRFIPVINRVLFFTAGIFWTKEWVGESGGGLVETVVLLNPAHHVVHQWRASLFGESGFDLPVVLFFIAISLVAIFPALRMARGPKVG